MELEEMRERVKTFANDFSIYAKEKAGEYAEQAKGLAEAAKAKLEIRGEEEKIKKAELEIGKLFYRDYVVGEEMDSAEYLPWCRKIDESNEQIAKLKQFIEELKEVEKTKAAAPAEAEEVAEADVTEEDFVVVCEEPEAKAPEAPAEEPKADTAE